MDNVGSHPLLSFRKMLSREFENEEGNITRKEVIERLESEEDIEFHYTMAQKIQSEFENAYKDMMRLSDNNYKNPPIQELMMQQDFENKPDNENLSELEIKILDTMTLNDIMQNYDRYYSVVVN